MQGTVKQNRASMSETMYLHVPNALAEALSGTATVLCMKQNARRSVVIVMFLQLSSWLLYKVVHLLVHSRNKDKG